MRVRLHLVFAALAVTALAAAAPASAAPWLWDQNQNRIDDRIEAVQAEGLAAAFVDHDLNGRKIFFVFPETTPLTYGVYVGYDHMPTNADVAALTATGAALHWRPRYIPYLRAKATFAQVQAIAALPGITRVEAWEAMYATNDVATRALRGRATEGGHALGLFPSVWKDLGITGKGVVVGILDSGVNDAPMAGGYPGHEALVGKFVGGGNFSNPDASLNTPTDGSENPANTLDPEGTYHGTHVAATAIGRGGPTGLYTGMAPDAKLVDCKVLTDAGVGGGAADALEWCIAHKDSVWNVPGEPGVVYRGVQVVNMSIGGTTESDGTEANAAAVNAAVRAGIVVCVATGNDGNTNYMPAPVSADLSLAVGAFEDGNTAVRPDDVVSSFSNEGPRKTDGDLDHVDEMKPSVLGSGSDIMSASGDPTTDGTRYHNINGTSMSSPNVAGLCALVMQANPGLTALEARSIVQNTADHRRDNGKQAVSAADPFGIDPNYHPSWGWGQSDAYAAVKEALDERTTQVVFEGTTAVTNLGGQLQIAVRWVTQREVDVTQFQVWRAPDLAGLPGAFAAVSPAVTPVGHPDIERRTNRTPYNWTDTDPTLVVGQPYWYEVRWTDTGAREHREPAFRVTTAVPPVRARVKWVVTHTALDNDALIRFGSGTNPDAPAFFRPGKGKPGADSSRVIAPGVGDGLARHWFHHDLTDDDQVAGFLPPSSANPWFLTLREEGFVNTEGVVDSFSITVYNGPTATTYVTPNPSTPTVERQTTTMWIPLDPITTPNHTPVLAPIGAKAIGEGLPLTFAVSATDADNQALTYTTSALPSGATFDAGTRTFAWTPGYSQAGSYPVTFRVRDAFVIPAADSEVVTITVQERTPGSNTPPVLASIPDYTTRVSSRLLVTVSAQDVEDATLTYSATSVPAGATFDPGTRTFDWTPFYGDEGHVFRVVFHATDPAGAADSQAVLVTVTPAGPPTFATDCSTDTTVFGDTIGVNVNGATVVRDEIPFVVGPNVAAVKGLLTWSGGPAIDLDLYLIDASGNVVQSGATATGDPEVALYANPLPGAYTWRVESFTNPNPSLEYTVHSIRCTRTSVAVDEPGGTIGLALAQNAPNPFRRSSLIRFALPQTGQVSLRIYDVSGRKVRTLAEGTLPAGSHQRVWDGRDDRGDQSHAGVYFYRLESAQGVRAKRMVYLH